MFSSRIRAGVRAGMIAAAATAGAVIGFGVRHNDWAGPFQSLGMQVLRGLGVTSPALGLAAMIGMMAHLAWMIVWGIAFTVLAHRRASAVALLFALLVTGVAVVVSRTLIPAASGAVSFAAMPGIQAALYAVLMIAGLMTGRALSRAD